MKYTCNICSFMIQFAINNADKVLVIDAGQGSSSRHLVPKENKVSTVHSILIGSRAQTIHDSTEYCDHSALFMLLNLSIVKVAPCTKAERGVNIQQVTKAVPSTY